MSLKQLAATLAAVGFYLMAIPHLTGCTQTGKKTTIPEAKSHEYPLAERGDVVDTYHGVEVPDPYRWLEDPDSPQTRAWIDAQNEITFSFLEQIPEREPIRERLTELWNYEKYGIPYKQGGKYFFSRNDGLQNQSVIYVLSQLDGEPRQLIDPNNFSDDGTVALAGYSISDDGRYFAYGVSDAGSDWVKYRVRDVDTGEDLDDLVRWIKFSGVSWRKDGSGFYYSRYDEPTGDKLQDVNFFQKLYFHQLGTPQADDKLVYHRPDQKKWGFSPYVTDDGKYLIVRVQQGTERENGVFYKDLTAQDAEFVELLNDFDAKYDFIGNDGPVFWFETNLDAPMGRVVAIDTRNPDRQNWVELIPEARETLLGVSVVGERFIARYLRDAAAQVKIFQLDGTFSRDVKLPGIGSVYGFGGERDDPETFFAYTSFSTPTTVYRFDVRNGQSRIFRKPEVDFDPNQFVTWQVFATSRDGTRVPLFITHKRGLQLDGKNPAFLYGYGGFNIPLTPRFSISKIVWMEMGGVYAVANLRGGGEYGREWHEAGKKLNRQNVFDDFVACAKKLVAERYTRTDKLAISGSSNGGLLVGACMTQWPEMFGAALPDVGVLDMLRFHKFTIGWAWVSDYGSPENPEEFQALYSYSPYHAVRPGTAYPATMITTADHDDRVVPLHSFKFAAALQYAQAGPDPILIRIETRAGHGAGKPTSKRIEEITDQLAFLVEVLDIDARQAINDW